MKIGMLIVIDGGDGAGKGTCISKLSQYLEERGFDVVVTREPGGTVIGERTRELILDKSVSEMTSTTELLLFTAARAQHVEEKIVPAINAGKIVISDRFSSATISFQHYARGLPFKLIEELNRISVLGLEPSMTIVLDIDPHIGLSRVSRRGKGFDRIEKENFDFLERARNGYIQQAKRDPEKFSIIDATLSPDEVFAKVCQIVDNAIELGAKLN